MKNSIRKLINGQSADQNLNQACFLSVKGDSFSHFNHSKYSNTGTS